MRWAVFAVLARFTLCAGLSRHTNYITKNITQCPDVGYFFERVVRPNAIEPDCQLCFCKEGDIALCWRREGKRCQEKESKRRITPKDSTAAKAEIKPLPNKNEKCKPFTSVSKDCPPTDWCLGCTVCNCDRNGKWDCHILSFCSDKKGEPIRTTNSLAESLLVFPNTTHTPRNIRKKRIPEIYIRRNPSEVSNVRKSSMINRAPDSRLPRKPTTRSSQKLPIQGKKEKQDPSKKVQRSLTTKRNIVRPARQGARKPRISNKVAIKNNQRKLNIGQTTSRIPPLNMNSSEVQIVLKKFIINLRKVSEKNLIKKKPLRIGKVTKKALKKITKPKFTSKSKAATMNKYSYNSKAGPCRADGKQDRCKPNNFTKLKPPRFSVKNKNNQETSPKRQNIKQSKSNNEQNERNIRAHRASNRSNSKKPLFSKSDNLNNYTYQHSKSKEHSRKVRAPGIHKQEINGQKNGNQNNKGSKNTKSVRSVTRIAWQNMTNGAGVFSRRKRKVNHTSTFEYKNSTNPENIEDNFETLESAKIVDELTNCSLSIENSAKYSISGVNLKTNFDLQNNDNTDDANSIKHLNKENHPGPNQSMTGKLQERDITVTEMENNEHVLITKDNDVIIENFMLFPKGRDIKKKKYVSADDITQSNLLSLSKDKHKYIKESNPTDLQRTRRQNNTFNGTVPNYERKFVLLPLTLPNTNLSLEGAIVELEKIELDTKKSIEYFQSLFTTNDKMGKNQRQRKIRVINYNKNNRGLQTITETSINKTIPKNTNENDKRTNAGDIITKKLEQDIKKMTYLFRKHKLMQNAFLTDLNDVLIKLNNITTLSASKEYPSNTELSREKELKDIQLYVTSFAENLKKIKILARDMAINRGRRKREIGDEVSFDYLLMAIEYLLKNNYMAIGPPAGDGIDLLADAIRNAPDIKLTKQKLYDSQLTHTRLSKVAASPFRVLTTPEESIAINQFDPRYLKESKRNKIKKNKEKMDIIEKELEKEISEAEPEKGEAGKEPARELPKSKFEKVLERTPEPFEMKNKTASFNLFEIDEDEEESDENNYFRIMKRTSNPKIVTEVSKPPAVINLKVYQEYRPTKDTKSQTGSKSDEPHEASKYSNEEETRRKNDIKGNVDENVSSNDSQVTLAQPATTEESRPVPIRTESPKTETKPSEVTPTVGNFNWYKESDTNDEYEDKSKQGGNKLIWTDEDLDEQNKKTKYTRTTSLTTTRAYNEQTYPSIKIKKHKMPPHKVMLKKEMNLLKSLEYDTEKEEDSDSSETRTIMFSLY